MKTGKFEDVQTIIYTWYTSKLKKTIDGKFGTDTRDALNAYILKGKTLLPAPTAVSNATVNTTPITTTEIISETISPEKLTENDIISLNTILKDMYFYSDWTFLVDKDPTLNLWTNVSFYKVAKATTENDFVQWNLWETWLNLNAISWTLSPELNNWMVIRNNKENQKGTFYIRKIESGKMLITKIPDIYRKITKASEQAALIGLANESLTSVDGIFGNQENETLLTGVLLPTTNTPDNLTANTTQPNARPYE